MLSHSVQKSVSNFWNVRIHETILDSLDKIVRKRQA